MSDDVRRAAERTKFFFDTEFIGNMSEGQVSRLLEALGIEEE